MNSEELSGLAAWHTAGASAPLWVERESLRYQTEGAASCIERGVPFFDTGTVPMTLQNAEKPNRSGEPSQTRWCRLERMTTIRPFNVRTSDRGHGVATPVISAV